MFELKDGKENLTGTLKTTSDRSGFAILQRHKHFNASVLITAEDAPTIYAELGKYVDSLKAPKPETLQTVLKYAIEESANNGR